MGQFTSEKQQNGGELSVTLKGHIDEDATFSGLELGGASKVVVDLAGVSAINSCGIREWIKWIRTAPSNSKVVYRNCPKVIVDQINMVAGFLPDNGKVESFYVPYFSDSSGNEKMILFREGAEFKGNELFPPGEVKDESGEAMEMDVIEAKYFKFLQK
jgi:anti-anti-sigma regulatory factor